MTSIKYVRITTIKELVSGLCKVEGLKSQVEVGDMREIIGHLSDIIFKEIGDDNLSGAALALWKNGRARTRRRTKIE